MPIMFLGVPIRPWRGRETTFWEMEKISAYYTMTPQGILFTKMTLTEDHSVRKCWCT